MAVEAEKRLDRRIAWTTKIGGFGAAIIGVFGPESWILPGLAFGAGGLIYENVTEPKQKTKMESSGTIFQRAREIYTGSSNRKSDQYALAA